MPEENDVGEGHQNDFLDQCVLECVNGVINEFTAVVERLESDAGGQTGRDLGNLGFDSLDDRFGIFAGTHHNRTADGFVAVEVERAAAVVTADLDGGDVFEINRGAFDRFDGD